MSRRTIPTWVFAIVLLGAPSCGLTGNLPGDFGEGTPESSTHVLLGGPSKDAPSSDVAEAMDEIYALTDLASFLANASRSAGCHIADQLIAEANRALAKARLVRDNALRGCRGTCDITGVPADYPPCRRA